MNILFKYDHILCKQTIRVKKLTLEYTYQVKKKSRQIKWILRKESFVNK